MYLAFFQISEASEEGSLEPNHELSQSDQDNINQKDDDELDNIEKPKDDLKTDDKELNSDDDYVEMNQINPLREVSSNTITNDTNEAATEENNDNEKAKEDEKTKEATTTTSKDISIQTDPNTLSPNKYRYLFVSIIYIYIIFNNVRNVIKLITNFSRDHIKVM